MPVQSGVEVVVNDSVQQQMLSVTTIRAIFGMRLRTWPDGKPIRVFVLNDDDPLHVAFSKKILNIFPHQLRLAWDRLVFSGTGQAPYQVGSAKEMRARVATTPGAIGYLGEGMINDSVRVPAITR
jgi:ABC-type phosphate transport system substrate-binding protein